MNKDKHILIHFLKDFYLFGALLSLWLRFEVRDCWIGFYWDVQNKEDGGQILLVYFCFVPLLPIIFKYDPIGVAKNDDKQRTVES